MNEEKDLIKRYGKKQAFKVPEGYFENFAEDLMRKLPEKEIKAPVCSLGCCWQLCLWGLCLL